ncbi:putative MFS transporter [Paraburkholderia sp. BL6669N2]|uniref:MFS transporter n=1 Tax=Paraburkholderia sp. BL6669N2 TaxID=1938807 RepID=UPI000E3A1A35|nr:MFS transporter [Paraburkholderia sp. BL6669N2]REG50968.1 putative MFS transporter [Paraburkholderia sp. BL6669N2]
MSWIASKEDLAGSQVDAAQPADGAADITARLDRIASSRSIWALVILISCGGFFEYYELFSVAYIAPGIIRSGILTATTTSFFGMTGIASFIAATFAGLLVGTLCLGFVADKLGRRSVFTFALIGYSVACAIMAFQTTAFGLNAWRFVAGIGLGVEMVTMDAYLSELMPKNLRGRAFALNSAIIFSALPVSAFVAWRLVPLTPLGLEGWRWVVLIGCAGAVVIWFLRLGIPESPRWLVAHGRIDAAARIVAALEARVERATGRPLGSLPSAAALDQTQSAARDMWSARYLKRTVMLSVFNFFQAIGLYGFVNWIPTYLVAQGIGLTSSLGYTFYIAFVMPIGALVAMTFADRFERKWQMIVGAFIVASFGLAFAEIRNAVGIVVCGGIVALTSTILNYNFHAYQAELFPTAIRARAVGWVYSWSRLSAMLSGFLVAHALKHSGVRGALALIAGAMLIAALVILVGGPRTKNRSLESISS